eukprot:scaffold2308_cov92-Isochrysis_galbana.AAC.3
MVCRTLHTTPSPRRRSHPSPRRRSHPSPKWGRKRSRRGGPRTSGGKTKGRPGRIAVGPGPEKTMGQWRCAPVGRKTRPRVVGWGRGGQSGKGVREGWWMGAIGETVAFAAGKT